MRLKLMAVLITGVLLAPALAPSASALPPGFPDLSGFSTVSADQYFVEGNAPGMVTFSTPYDLTCSFTREAGGHSSQYLRCKGQMADSNDPCAFGEITWESSKDSYDRTWEGSDCTNRFAYARPLSPGQKVSFGNVTCAVGDNRLSACLDTFNGEHGFFMQPSGSRFF
ncbi:hypothetical protein [Mycobacterium conspicuum]|nr:hypothetical protein [Mycobacterium conspicuum]